MALESSGTDIEVVQVFEFGQFRADLRARTLLCGGQPVAITSKVFDTLAFLLRNHGQVVEKDQLLKTIWPDTVVEESNLHHYISTVRKVLGEKSGENRFIATVPGRGYSFVGPVRLVAQESPEVSRALRRRLVLVAALSAVVALLVVGSRSVAHRTPPDRPPIKHLTASLGVAEMASFSPDGKEVVFSWRVQGEENSHLYTKAIGSETMLPITRGADSYSYPAWSPDGTRIAFIRHLVARGAAEFCLMPARGGPVTVLAPANVQANNTTKIVWTKDGNHVITESLGTSSQMSRLTLLSVDGKQRRLLASAVEQSGDIAPAVSPDGKLLAFVRGTRVGNELRVMPTMGDESKVLLAGDRGVLGSGIAWTPDSRGIVYSTREGLWKVPLSGGDPARLGIGSNRASYPAISKRGDLAFTEPATQVTLIRATLPQPGQGPVAVRELFSSTRTVLFPQWSPDGKQIAFCSNRSGSTEIYRSDAEGGSLAQLTFLAVGGDFNPRWSPDGKTIAFEAAPTGNSSIYLISASGGAPRRLTTEPSKDTHAAWSNDGETIYFSSDRSRSGTNQVWKMPVAGGPASQVTSDGGYFPAVSADRHLYFLKDRMSKTVWRMPLDGGRAEVMLDGGLFAPRLWTPTAEGVYYLDRTSLRFFDVRSRRHTEALVQFQPTEISVTTTIGASSDGRSMLIPRFRQSGTDVMLVERFW